MLCIITIQVVKNIIYIVKRFEHTNIHTYIIKIITNKLFVWMESNSVFLSKISNSNMIDKKGN